MRLYFVQELCRKLKSGSQGMPPHRVYYGDFTVAEAWEPPLCIGVRVDKENIDYTLIPTVECY